MEEREFRRQLLELYPEIASWACHFGCPYQEADDIAQDTMFLALRGWKTFDATRSLRAWVSGIVKNRFLDYARRAQRELIPFAFVTENDLQRVTIHPTQHSQCEISEAREAANVLPSELRDPLLLSWLEWSQMEIAEELNCPLGTIKSRMRKAKRVLQEELA